MGVLKQFLVERTGTYPSQYAGAQVNPRQKGNHRVWGYQLSIMLPSRLHAKATAPGLPPHACCCQFAQARVRTACTLLDALARSCRQNLCAICALVAKLLLYVCLQTPVSLVLHDSPARTHSCCNPDCAGASAGGDMAARVVTALLTALEGLDGAPTPAHPA